MKLFAVNLGPDPLGSQKPVTEAWRLRCMGVAAQCWCEPAAAHIPMDPTLALVFSEVLARQTSRPWLGVATTGELLNELRSRVVIDRTTELLMQAVEENAGSMHYYTANPANIA